MIIQCDQCKTRFRLDDSKVTESGVRVRCSRCKHTFVVKRDAYEETDGKEAEQGWENSPNDTQNELDTAERSVKDASVASEEASEKQPQGAFPESEEASSAAIEPCSAHGLDEHTFIAASGVPDSPLGTEAKSNNDETPGLHLEGDSVAETGQEADADDFLVSGTQDECGAGMAFEEMQVSLKESGIDGFPDDSFEPDADEEETAPGISFGDGQAEMESDQSWKIYADEPDCGVKDGERPEREVYVEQNMSDKDEDEFFPMGSDARSEDTSDTTGEFMEGVAEKILESKREGERESEGFAAFGETESTRHFGGVADDELPPLSITSRRKSSRRLYGFLAALVTIVGMGGVAVFCFSDKEITALRVPDLSAVANWFTPAKGKEGEISIRNLDGAFIRNKKDGEYFVVRGEALNQSKRPRTYIRIQAYIYGVKGDVVMKNLAFLGENISNEQLTTLSSAEIEAFLKGKQEKPSGGIIVQPGQGIPFLVVFRNVPRGVGEFGAEAIGSTAVSQ